MTLRIGTRRSRLATAQAQEIAAMLRAEGHEVELVPIVTAGDRGASADSSSQGLKGLFVAEIVRALLDGDVDLAVHSAKDLPAEDTRGVALGAVPRRERPFDALVSREATPGPGAVVGTSALRRRAQLARSHPQLEVVAMRGNVDTRLEKLEAGDVDALVVAEAGLHRLGRRPAHATTLGIDAMVPAPGQGALAVQCRDGDDAVRAAIAPLDDPPTRTALEAERGVMRRLGGGCALPLGSYAVAGPARVQLIGLVATPDGARIARSETDAPTAEDAAEIVADELMRAGAAEILAAAREA